MTSNFVTSTVVTAPSPAASGTTLTVTSGTGARFYAGKASIYPTGGALPTPVTAEIVTISSISADTLTIVRAQESSTARTIVTGDVILQGVTAGMWDDVVATGVANTAAALSASTAAAAAMTAATAAAVTASAASSTATSAAAVASSASTAAAAAAAEAAAATAAVAAVTTLDYVRITSASATFTPVAELSDVSTASVTWTVEETGEVQTGASASFSWGSALDRHVRLTVADGDGSDALATDLVMINLGYDHTEDAGVYVMGAQYNKPSESVSKIEGVHQCSALVRFAAADTALAGEVSFRGLSNLEYVECYRADIQSVDITGCTALIRLVVEQTNLTYLDLDPVRGNLYDLRAAAQQGSAITMAALTSPMTQLYHYCIRDQTVTNMAAPSTDMPAVQQLWIWNTGQSGALTPVSNALTDLRAYSNSYTSADLSGATSLTYIDLHDNALDESAVDDVLVEVASWGTSNGTLNLSSNTAPSATGLAAQTTLEGRSWTVTVDGSEPLWSDDFERADVSGLANVDNGWATPGSADADIVSGDLVRTDTVTYEVLYNPTDVVLPADYTVTATLTGASIGTFLGIVGRWTGGTGVAAFFNAGTAITDLYVMEADVYLHNSVLVTPDNAIPASFTDGVTDSTFAVEFSGTTVNVYCDGVLVGHATLSVNETTNTGVGMCGVGSSRHLKSIEVTA